MLVVAAFVRGTPRARPRTTTSTTTWRSLTRKIKKKNRRSECASNPHRNLISRDASDRFMIACASSEEESSEYEEDGAVFSADGTRKPPDK